MRLTLRTLIAYLDQTISKDDSAALRSKINDSESIRVLIERIKRVISQPQLMAARATGRGLGANPNYASEYLDSTLDVEQVPEFEKLVIGSDMLLAEVCEAHQILADIAELDASASSRLKNRLYKTTDEIYKKASAEPDVFPVIEDQASVKENSVGASSKSPPPVIKPKINSTSRKSTKSKWRTGPGSPPENTLAPPRPTNSDSPLANDSNEDLAELPGLSLSSSRLDESTEDVDGTSADLGVVATDSLHSTTGKAAETKTNVRPVKLVPVILVTVCLTALVSLIFASYWFPRINDVTPEMANNQSPTVNADGGNDEATGENNALKSDTGDLASKGDSPDSELGAKTDSDPSMKLDERSSIESGKTQAAGAPNVSSEKVGNGEQAKDGQEFQPLPPIESASGNGDEMVESPKSDELINLFKDKDYDKKAKSGEKNVTLNPEKESSGMSKGLDANEKKKPETSPGLPAPAALNNGPAVAVLKTSIEPIIRKTDLPEAMWVGLLGNGTVHLNDTVVALPNCQPEFNILEKVQLKMFGFSKIEFKPNDGKVLPLIVAHNGIGSLQNLSDPNTAIDLMIGTKKFQVAFPDKKSETVFLTYSENQRSVVDSGALPVRTIQFASLRGRAIIKFDDAVKTLAKGQFLTIDNSISADEVSVEKFKVQPRRITESADNLTESAKESLMSMIQLNPIVAAGADKLLSDTKTYVRKFAVESDLAINSSLSAIEFLNNPQNRSFWRAIVFSIRDRMQTDSEFSEIFRRTLLENYDDLGEAMIAMLAVGSNSQLESGSDKLLVDNLESPELVVRVTAIEVLFAITGKNYLFRATNSERDRKKHVNSWKKALENGEIRFREPLKLDLFH